MLEQERAIAVDAVRLSATICRAVQGEITPGRWDKGDRTPVTVADLATQAVVSRILEQHFPVDPLMAEEGADELREPAWADLLTAVTQRVHLVQEDRPDSAKVLDAIDRGQRPIDPNRRYWILDPVDGTKGFLRKEQYAIALALIERGEILLGVLGCPNLPSSLSDKPAPGGAPALGQIYVAVRGQGAHCIDLSVPVSEQTPREVRVTHESDPALVAWCERVETGPGNQDRTSQVVQHAGIVREPYRIDSQAKYAVVGRGEAALYLRHTMDPTYHEKVWDHAAGVILVEEAGGRSTDLYGRQLDFSQGRQLDKNRGIVCTNGLLHDRVLEAVQAVLGAPGVS